MTCRVFPNRIAPNFKKVEGHRMGDMVPYLFYAAGSLCFLIGTLLAVWAMVR